MCSWLEKVFRPDRRVSERIEQLDQRNRELRHDINNIRASASALERLVAKMREDDTWRTGRDPVHRD